MHNQNLIKSNPASIESEITKHLRCVAEEMAKESRSASEAQDAIKAEYNYAVNFRAPHVMRHDYNRCKEILEKTLNKEPLTRSERRHWDRLVIVQHLEPQGPITEVRQTGKNKEN